MNCFAHVVIAPEGERDIADPTAYERSGTGFFYVRNGFDKVEGIGVVLFHASGDGENVGVEDNIAGLKADSLGEDGVCTLTDTHLVLDVCRLSRLIKGHYDDGCSVAPADLRLLDKALFPFFKA